MHVSWNPQAMAVMLAHEIVHVTGSALGGTSRHYSEEQQAWGSAFSVYRAFGSQDRALSGFTGRYNLWTTNRREFDRQIACGVFGNCNP